MTQPPQRTSQNPSGSVESYPVQSSSPPDLEYGQAPLVPAVEIVRAVGQSAAASAGVEITVANEELETANHKILPTYGRRQISKNGHFVLTVVDSPSEGMSFFDAKFPRGVAKRGRVSNKARNKFKVEG